MRVLNVAEKPSVAKSISEILSQGHCSKRAGQSPFNPIFEFGYTLSDGRDAQMSVTSVLGHILTTDIDPAYGWGKCEPGDLFFTAPVQKSVAQSSERLASQLKSLARNCELLILWLDCDREGEAIGYEVLSICRETNPRIRVQRAHFSALIPRDIHDAMRTLTDPDPHMRDAVEARQEIDLRIGAAFTRWQTDRLRKKFPGIEEVKNVVSYGPCQFPTLGFVVDRYLKRERFVSQGFWTIEMEIKHDNAVAKFRWTRDRLYDRLCCALLFESCFEAGQCTIADIQNKQTIKSRPVPLATVEMQKMLSRPPYRLSSSASMDIAEKLYQRGFISYPRTETDKFKEGTDLQHLIQVQTGDREWGAYANSLLMGGFCYPRDGGHDDSAHPPIHPTKPPEGLNQQENQVYDFIARHFLACCSKDAVGQQSIVTAVMADERFTARGLTITQRNFLDVYSKYERWGENSLPNLQRGHSYVPSLLMMRESKTEPPPLLSVREHTQESDLITLMDKNGIGTDATIAQHIKTIQDRGYANCEGHVFTPTRLGLGLVEGYEAMSLQMAQPTLRAHMESELMQVSRGLKRGEDVVRDTLAEMQRVFHEVERNAATLDLALQEYLPAAGSGGDSASAILLTASFSRCGLCGGMCDLKKTASANQQWSQRLLHCDTCHKSYSVPSKHTLQPHAHTCPICQFQVLQVNNEEKNTTWTLCPYCFNFPPQGEIEDTGQRFGSGFKCFQCTRADCVLASKSDTNLAPHASSRVRAPNEPVRACDACGQMMTLKTFPNGGYYLGCTNFPTCSNKKTFSCKEVQLTADVCNTCAPAPNGFRPRLLSFTFNPGQAPPHISNPLITCVNGCDEEANELFDLLRRNVQPAAPRPGPPGPGGAGGRPPSGPGGQSFRPAPSATSSLPFVPPPSNTFRVPIIPPRNPARADGPAGFINTDRTPSPASGYDSGNGGGRRRGASASASSAAGGGRKPRSTKASGTRAPKGRGGKTSRGSASSSRFNRAGGDGDDDDGFGGGGGDFVSSYRQEQQQLARDGAWQDSGAAAAAPSYMSGGGGAGGGEAPSWRYNPNSAASSGGGGGSSYGGGDLSAVRCFRCSGMGHYANACPSSSSGGGGGGSASTFSRGGGRGGGAAAAGRGGRAPARGGRSGGGGGGGGDVCYKCNQSGHWAADCPNR